MKVLSIKNPWALAIMILGKDIENRTWRTEYRGRLLVHTSVADDRTAYHGSFGDLFKETTFQNKLRFGYIIGSVELYGCVNNSDSKWAETGLWHWQLKEPVLFDEPIAVKGSLGLWKYSGSLPEKV